MAKKRKDGLEGRLAFFTRRLPNAKVLFSILMFFSFVIGIFSLALINYQTLARTLPNVLVTGVIVGLLLFIIPALVTVLTMKLFKRIAKIKHILAIASVATGVYGLFFLVGSALYALTGAQALFFLLVLLGDATIFAGWFMIAKIALGKRRSAPFYALLQPSLNLLLLAPLSGYLFNFSLPLSVLLIKLYASIFIFLVISYIVLFIFDGPIKRSMGLDGLEVFSQMVQSWLFNIDAEFEKNAGKDFGIKQDIETNTVVIKKKDGRLKAVLFSPWLHFGPAGTIGGSNFPYMLERHVWGKYGVPGVIMHATINEDLNPVTDTQINEIKSALDESIKQSKKVDKGGFSYSESKNNGACIKCVDMGDVCLTTFTRAPKITEDISPEVALLFKNFLENEGKSHLLLDAHNSRYESAPKRELDGVQPQSATMRDYVGAIKTLKSSHKTGNIAMGIGYSNPYNELHMPHDLAPGNINAVIFKFNGFKHAMIFFNANNMMPSLREEIIKHVKRKFSVDAEVYTTDTHFVNALNRTASNVLGRYSSFKMLKPFIERAVSTAILNIEPVEIYHKRSTMRNFLVWGPNIREKMNAVVSSVFSLARIAIPLLVAIAFVIAAWLITVV